MGEGEHSLPRILIDDRQDDVPLDIAGLSALAEETLVGEDAANAELSVSFVTEREIAELNARYAGEDAPTDVLSFPMGDLDEDGVRILGDVIVAPAVGARNNADDPAGELRLLIVHGILHLLGHDHMDDSERAEMWARQERYSGVPVGAGTETAGEERR
jgi:probable rRNA maturation factor